MKSIKKELFDKSFFRSIIFNINTYNIPHQRIKDSVEILTIEGDNKFIVNINKIGGCIEEFERDKIFGSFLDYMMYHLKP